jgi:hypothetical protein
MQIDNAVLLQHLPAFCSSAFLQRVLKRSSCRVSLYGYVGVGVGLTKREGEHEGKEGKEGSRTTGVESRPLRGFGLRVGELRVESRES